MNLSLFWLFALGPTQTVDLANKVKDSPTASRSHSLYANDCSRNGEDYGSLPGGFRWNQRRPLAVGYAVEAAPRGATTLNGCVKAVCTPRARVYGTFYKRKTRSGHQAERGGENPLAEVHGRVVAAGIFARRLKLLNFLPSFTANIAPARKKSCRGPLGCSDAHAPRTAAGSRMGSRTRANAKADQSLTCSCPGEDIPPSIY